MKPEDIEQEVIYIVSEQFAEPESAIDRDTNFYVDLNADSLDTIELIMELEDEFEIGIDNEEAEYMRTVGDVVDWLVNHLS